MNYLINMILSIIDTLGFWGIVISMMMEGVIIIIPSELVLATAGIMVSRGTMSMFLAILAGVLGSTLCAIVIYCLGYFGGRPFIEKYGKFFFMDKEDIDKAEKWFEKYGLISALIGRCFPIIRTFISLPIGMARINFIKFTIYTIIGSIPWTIAFVFGGYKLGQNYVIIEKYINMFKLPIIIICVALVGIYLYKKINKRIKNKKTNKEQKI